MYSDRAVIVKACEFFQLHGKNCKHGMLFAKVLRNKVLVYHPNTVTYIF